MILCGVGICGGEKRFFRVMLTGCEIPGNTGQGC